MRLATARIGDAQSATAVLPGGVLPGDVICTGTLGAVEIRSGDVAGCRISSFEPLSNPVRR